MSTFREDAKGKAKEVSPEIMTKAKNNIDRTRAKLLLKQPFYGVLLSMADITCTTDLPTMATDGIKIFYNPEFVSGLSEQEINGVMLHEISHCIYMHCSSERRLNRDRHRWNVATDFAINLEIDGMSNDYQLPKIALLDHKYAGKNAEQIYDELPKDVSKMETMDTHLEPMDGTADWDEMEDKIIAAYESTKDYYENEKNQGKLPSGIRRFIDQMRKAKVSWERIFHRYVGQALAKDDFSYTRCNRRYMSQDIYLPDLRNHTIGSVVIGVDTSGSITRDILEQFSAEMAKVSYLIDEVTVMTCDAQVHEVVKIHKMQGFLDKLEFKGGGGTAFEPVFEKVKEMNIYPELLIYLTDSYGSFGDKPQYPVLWVLTEENGSVPWGQVVHIPKEKK